MGQKQVMKHESFCHAGHNYRRAVKQPDSWFRRMFWELEMYGTVTRLEFFTDWKPEIVHDGKVRPGWGTQYLSGFAKCGLIQMTKFRRDGYPVYDKGPRWDYWNRVVNIARYGETCVEDTEIWNDFQTPKIVGTEWDHQTSRDIMTLLDGTEVPRFSQRDWMSNH